MARISRLFGLSLALAAGSAMAGGSITDMFSYSGFGTAGVARTDTNDAEYVQTGQTSGAKENFDYKTDSKLGLQGTLTPAQWLSGTAQVLTQQRFGPDFTTKFEWAFVKIKPLPGLSLRGGQMALPTFLISDSRKVGYANTWVRAPDEVYGQATFDTYKGYNVTYQHAIGPYSLTLDALAGSMKGAFLFAPGTQVIIDGHKLRGYSASLDMSVVTVRISRVTTNYVAKLDNFIAGRGIYTFGSFGVIYDHNDVLLQGEFIERRTGNPAFNVNGLYVLGGYHIGKWIPYAMYAAGKRVGGASGAVPELNKNTVSAGVRLDWFQSVDFKAQIDHVKAFPNGDPFIYVRPGFGNEANVFSLAVDFVF
ncbi:MAG: hypothetical protein QOG17_1228 [Gammaproteobacteria bacterium]|jgi:hypothetical protein|nr:hypothetical protein [Gammaproteobacteria bacterium]